MSRHCPFLCPGAARDAKDMCSPPHGLGYDVAIIEALQEETREMLLREKMAEVQALGEHGTNQHTNGGGNHGNVLTRGNSSRYRIARLKRDTDR
jgi:hypothetical protein